MTNWEKVKAGLTAETFTALVSTAWSELGTCDYCPEECRAFCEQCKAEYKMKLEDFLEKTETAPGTPAKETDR